MNVNSKTRFVLKKFITCCFILASLFIRYVRDHYYSFVGSKENTFESEQKMLEDLITENWLHLQENGNPFTWEDEFLKAKLLTKYENEPNTSKPRALLVELILTECLQNAKKTEDIKLISSVIFSSTVSATKHGGGEKNAPSRGL